MPAVSISNSGLVRVNPNQIRGYHGLNTSANEHFGIELNSPVRLFGCEFEYEISGDSTITLNRLTRALKELKIGARLKGDCSLRNGVEIETCARPIEQLFEEFSEFWSHPACSMLYSTEGCGMHVHISKARVHYRTWARFGTFIHRSGNRDYLNYLGGRTPTHYCTYARNFSRENVTANKEYSASLGGGGRGAMAFRQGTIEMRFPRSPQTEDDFQVRVGLFDALIAYCAHNRLRPSFNWPDFDYYVARQVNENNKTIWYPLHKASRFYAEGNATVMS